MTAGQERIHRYLSGGGDGEHKRGHSGTAEVEQTTLETKKEKNDDLKQKNHIKLPPNFFILFRFTLVDIRRVSA